MSYKSLLGREKSDFHLLFRNAFYDFQKSGLEDKRFSFISSSSFKKNWINNFLNN